MKNLIRQPFNTFTNFIYIINGLYFFSKGIEDIQKKRNFNLITANRFYSFTLAAIMCYIFLSSSFFHSSLVEIASKIDYAGVYSIALFPLMYFTHRVSLVTRGLPSNKKHQHEQLALISVFSAIYILLTFVIPMSIVHLTVVIFILLMVCLCIYLETKMQGRTNRRYLFGALFTLIIAIMFFEFDFAKIMCAPEYFIHPHNFWHLFNGFSMFYFYLYIRSESYQPEYDKLRLDLHHRIQEKHLGITKSNKTED